jgi:GNAT superfamily N-acetyltransferase
MVNVRAFVLEDVGEIKSLIGRTMATSYRDVYSPRAIAFFNDYHSLENIKNDATRGSTVVAIEDGKMVGTCTLLEDEIKRVFVDPEYQGRGIGREMMRTRIAEAKDRGLRSVRLEASLVSRAVYEHLGFRFIGDGRHELGNGLGLDYYFMVLDL